MEKIPNILWLSVAQFTIVKPQLGCSPTGDWIKENVE